MMSFIPMPAAVVAGEIVIRSPLAGKGPTTVARIVTVDTDMFEVVGFNDTRTSEELRSVLGENWGTTSLTREMITQTVASLGAKDADLSINWQSD